MECTMGIMTSKWKVLTSAIKLDVATVDTVVNLVLHNLLWQPQAGFGDSPVNQGLGRHPTVLYW